MINCKDISSCDLQRCLLGESTNGDSDEDGKDVDQGIALPAAANLQHPMLESMLDARPPPNDHSHRVAVIAAIDVLAPLVDKFYNVAGKAPHPDAVIPKIESD